jgi:hypothetical protein
VVRALLLSKERFCAGVLATVEDRFLRELRHMNELLGIRTQVE